MGFFSEYFKGTLYGGGNGWGGYFGREERLERKLKEQEKEFKKKLEANNREVKIPERANNNESFNFDSFIALSSWAFWWIDDWLEENDGDAIVWLIFLISTSISIIGFLYFYDFSWGKLVLSAILGFLFLPFCYLALRITVSILTIAVPISFLAGLIWTLHYLFK